MFTGNRIIILFTIVAFARVGSMHAQQVGGDTFGHSFIFNAINTEPVSSVTQPVYITVPDTAISSIFGNFGPASGNRLGDTRPYSPLVLGVKLNPSLRQFFAATVQSVSKQYYSFVISDSSDAVLAALGINEANYRHFVYHVVENDSAELLPWAPVPLPSTAYGSTAPFSLIGTYNWPGKRLMIEVRDKDDYSIREGVIFDWRRDFRPMLEQVILEVPGGYYNLHTDAMRRFVTRFNERTGAPLDLRFPVDSVRGITFGFRLQETIVHVVNLVSFISGQRDTLSLGFIDQNAAFRLDPELFNQPGHYELVFQRQSRRLVWDDSQLFRFPFDVTANDHPGLNLRAMLLVICSILVAMTLLIFLIQRRNRKRIAGISREKELAMIHLRALRSQLNPHFIFNALASIQNLVNKNSVEDANLYLSRFATLLREVMNSSGQDMISLGDELAIARHYLGMEQLRSGFDYEVTSTDLSETNVEVPPIILQPFIENAAKHGVASRPDGFISVSAYREGVDLVLKVTDNGEGIDPKSPRLQTGLGSNLSRERIALLNEIYPGKPFRMEEQTGDSGTTILIRLTQWL